MNRSFGWHRGQSSWRTYNRGGGGLALSFPHARFVPRIGMKPNEGSVLVVDDDPQIRRMVVKALATQNHTIREAENGIEGLNLLRKQGADLVISDIFMPKKEGIETILEIRRITPDTKIIAISGGGFSGRGGYLAQALRRADRGVDGHRPRPGFRRQPHPALVTASAAATRR